MPADQEVEAELMGRQEPPCLFAGNYDPSVSEDPRESGVCDWEESQQHLPVVLGDQGNSLLFSHSRLGGGHQAPLELYCTVSEPGLIFSKGSFMT